MEVRSFVGNLTRLHIYASN